MAYLSRKDQSFLNLAAKLAATSKCEQRHGAVIVKSGRVLALGVNSNKNYSDSLSANHRLNSSIHAEMDALSRVSNPKNAIIYIARINTKGRPVLSRPCDACYEKLLKAGIKRIYYTPGDVL